MGKTTAKKVNSKAILPDDTRGDEQGEQEQNKKNCKGRLWGSRTINSEKLNIILNVIEEHLPPGADMWRKVSVELLSHGEGKLTFRDWETIRDKFNRVVPKRKPTGRTVVKSVDITLPLESSHVFLYTSFV